MSLLALVSFADGLSTVVYGPQSRELLLLTSKLAAREGVDTFTICAPGTESGCRRLMYGTEYADADVDEPGMAKPISDGGDMQDALKSATCLTLVSYDAAVEEAAVNTLLESSGEELSKIVLLTKMGVTKAKGGFFGGGKDAERLDSEKALRKLCDDKGLTLSIVRAGVCKGGGPGPDGCDFGLSNAYYNTLIDAVEASVTMAHDKYTLGADCVKGDPIELPNAFSQMTTKSSFEACEYDTNRIVAASATVATMFAEDPLDFSVSSAKGDQLPTMEEWAETLSTMQS